MAEQGTFLDPLQNKGTAFSLAERTALGLHGLLPESVETIEQQLDRVYATYLERQTALHRHVNLRALQDTNEVLFFRLLSEHLAEMLPVIYTPTVAEACQNFSHIYRRPRGLFLSYPARDRLREALRNRSQAAVDVIVVTDGERVLGIGDQGIGGMAIPIGKLALYTVIGGIDPARTLPIMLDVGTNDPARLTGSWYLGWRHPRVTGPDYDAFIEQFVEAVRAELPDVLLQWEDFAIDHARPILERYQRRLLTFNDDIQGTAAVTLATVLAAADTAGMPLPEHRFLILGAGSAGTGVAEYLTTELIGSGLTADAARARFALVDVSGLIHDGRPDLTPEQLAFAVSGCAGGGLGGGRPARFHDGDELLRPHRPDRAVHGSRCVHRAAGARHGVPGAPPDHPAALEPVQPIRGRARRSPGLDRRAGAGGHRISVPAGAHSGRPGHHRAVQQRVHLPGHGPRRGRRQRHPRHRRHVLVRCPRVGDLQPGPEVSGRRLAPTGDRRCRRWPTRWLSPSRCRRWPTAWPRADRSPSWPTGLRESAGILAIENRCDLGRARDLLLVAAARAGRRSISWSFSLNGVENPVEAPPSGVCALGGRQPLDVLPAMGEGEVVERRLRRGVLRECLGQVVRDIQRPGPTIPLDRYFHLVPDLDACGRSCRLVHAEHHPTVAGTHRRTVELHAADRADDPEPAAATQCSHHVGGQHDIGTATGSGLEHAAKMLASHGRIVGLAPSRWNPRAARSAVVVAARPQVRDLGLAAL